MLPLSSHVQASRSRRNGLHGRTSLARSSRDANKDKWLSKLLFVAALLWPLIPLFLTSTSSKNKSRKQRLLQITSQLRTRLQELLDRYDILGYGPTHPRFAFVLVAPSSKDFANPVEAMTQTIQSIFKYTDAKRIFQIYAVFEPGTVPNQRQGFVETSLQELQGRQNSTHNPLLALQQDAMLFLEQNNTHDILLGRKVKVLFAKKRGIAANRRDVARILDGMVEQHEQAGIKSPNEDIILVMIRPGVQLYDKQWMDAVTGALILPPSFGESSPFSLRRKEDSIQKNVEPPLSLSDSSNPNKKLVFSINVTKLANAVSITGRMAPEHLSHGVNFALEPTTTKQKILDSSFPTPIVEGSVTALRLNTFLFLPAKDPHLESTYAADIELSWNLWLCADGIDILTGASAVLPTTVSSYKKILSNSDATRLASAWFPTQPSLMKKFMDARNLNQQDMKMDHSSTLPINLATKCRSFQWYASEVNNSSMIVESTQNAKKPQDKPIQRQPPPAHRHDVDIKAFKPLRPINMEIIARTHPIDLTYINVTQGFKEDPHRGAQDEHGSYGYVHDETALRRNAPSFSPPRAETCKVDGNYRMLTKKVTIQMHAHNVKEKNSKESGKARVKLFCIVYTIEKNHHRIPIIRETWGSKCDGFMVSSDATDRSLGTVHIPHEGPEEYENIWQKVRATWSYVYDNYYEKYDFFHIGGDDLYILVENMRLYLESDEILLASNGGKSLPTGTEKSAYPLFLGRRFAEQGNMDRIFNSGGAGYTLNKAALKALVVDAFPICMPHLRTFAEDVMVAECLREHVNVYPYDTKDDQGGERYMPFTPEHHLTYRLPPVSERGNSQDWYVKYSIDIKEGLDHCAADAATFHYIDKELMKKIHAILYGYCKN